MQNLIIKKSKRNGQFRAVLKGDNGEQVYISEQVTRHADAERAFDDMIRLGVREKARQGKLIELLESIGIHVTGITYEPVPANEQDQ